MFCLIVDREPAKKVVIFTSVISLLHAVVNPPLYAWMSQRYRQGYLFVFKMALSVCGGTRPNRRSLSKGLFTWREGAPANRPARLTELPWPGRENASIKHLHARHGSSPTRGTLSTWPRHPARWGSFLPCKWFVPGYPS